MYTQILDWIDNIGLTFLGLSVLIWAFHQKRLAKSVQILGIYLGLNLIIQLIAYLLWQKSMNNLYLLHINTFLEFVFFSLFFKEVYIKQAFIKKNIYKIIGVIGSLIILNSVFLEPLTAYNSNAKVLVQFIIISYVIIYFFDAYGKIDFGELKDQSISFICFAILVYYAGSLSTFMFNQFITDEMKEGVRPIWIINAFLNAIFQLILLFSILRLSLQSRKSIA